MDEVKALPPFPSWATPHVAALGGRMLEVVRQSLAEEDWKGLRSSHFRLLGYVPPEGTTVTDLAPVLRMTKQAAGQSVAYLESTGHLQVRTDALDRRRRVVTRTPEGDAVVAAVDAHLAQLERRWSDIIGPERYQVFRDVLRQLSDQ